MFPGVNPPRVVDPAFDTCIREATLDQNLRVDTEVFCDKVAQLRELLSVRHSVFVLGCACSAKTEVWRTLAYSQTRFGEKTVFSCLNPKAISSDELYVFSSAFPHAQPSAASDWLTSAIPTPLSLLSLITTIVKDTATSTRPPRSGRTASCPS
jgi:hypothetical protein